MNKQYSYENEKIRVSFEGGITFQTVSGQAICSREKFGNFETQ